MLNKIKVLVAIYKLKRLHFNIEEATTEQLLNLHNLASTVKHLKQLPQAATILTTIEETLYLRDIDGDNVPLI